MMNEEYVGNRLMQLRMKKGVSARDMSLSIGQNENYINNIENYKTSPSLQGLFYISEYLEITPEQFFSSEQQNPKQVQSIIDIIKTMNDDDLALILALIERIKTP
ncbi:helix-turn-helix domain-containing protein [Tannockella kyphosi]|uniref:helix-turn-helix domain-containing protein n=1 Tax=Tannockella kyphosi TaxID=2899121 RepID=UPI0020128479|nr:helix-turn-helix domain-containing protein [Tannockella kyphosi]